MDILTQFFFNKNPHIFSFNSNTREYSLYVKTEEYVGIVTTTLYKNKRGWYYYSIELNNHTRGGATEDTLDIIKEYNDFISQEQ